MSAVGAVALAFAIVLVFAFSALVRIAWRMRGRETWPRRAQAVGIALAFACLYCLLTLIGLGIVAIVQALA